MKVYLVVMLDSNGDPRFISAHKTLEGAETNRKFQAKLNGMYHYTEEANLQE